MLRFTYVRTCVCVWRVALDYVFLGERENFQTKLHTSTERQEGEQLPIEAGLDYSRR